MTAFKFIARFMFLASVLAAAHGVVHAAETAPERDTAALPEPVQRMRAALMEAAASGDLEAMRVPIEMNELPPTIGDAAGLAPIDSLRRVVKGDDTGRASLAMVIELLRTGFVRQGTGGDEMIVWPYFAGTKLADLTPAQETELLTILSPDAVEGMKTRGAYDYWRIGIGHDGVWHFLVDGPMPAVAAAASPKTAPVVPSPKK